MNKKQNHEAFMKLLEEHSGIIMKISRAYTNTLQDREDLAHDIILQLWQSYPRFEGRSAASTWFYRVALNTSMNYSRKNRKKREFMQNAFSLDAARIADHEESNPLIGKLYDCISELDAFSKAIIILYLDGHSHEEIASITGISKTNVGTRISRIRKRLKETAIKKNKHHGME